MMRFSQNFWAILAVIASGAPVGSADVREGPPLTLGQGEQRLIQIPGLRRFSIGSGILRSVPSPFARGDTLMLKAADAGRTDLWVWKEDGTTERRPVKIVEWRQDEDPKGLALERAVSQLGEVEVILTAGDSERKAKFLLRGEVTTLREAVRIRLLREGQPDGVVDETEPSPALLEEMQKALQRWLAQSRFRQSLRLERFEENHSLWLRGSIDSPSARAEVATRARAIAPYVRLEIAAMPDTSPTIHFKVFLLEMKKNKMRSLGLDWTGAVPSALSVGSWGVSEALRLEATLNALESEGSAKILSRPELVVRAPGEAELFAGGELPIESKTPYNSTVTWRQFGLLLRLKVLHVTAQKVRVDVTTEVSHLDPKLALREIPGLQANRMKTQVDAAFGSPLLLSGLLQESLHETARGLPGLSRLPVLGALFGSRDFQSDRSELVAILLPSNEPPRPPMEVISRTFPRAYRSPPTTGPNPTPTPAAEEDRREKFDPTENL